MVKEVKEVKEVSEAKASVDLEKVEAEVVAKTQPKAKPKVYPVVEAFMTDELGLKRRAEILAEPKNVAIFKKKGWRIGSKIK